MSAMRNFSVPTCCEEPRIEPLAGVTAVEVGAVESFHTCSVPSVRGLDAVVSADSDLGACLGCSMMIGFGEIGFDTDRFRGLASLVSTVSEGLGGSSSGIAANCSFLRRLTSTPAKKAGLAIGGLRLKRSALISSSTIWSICVLPGIGGPSSVLESMWSPSKNA